MKPPKPNPWKECIDELKKFEDLTVERIKDKHLTAWQKEYFTGKVYGISHSISIIQKHAGKGLKK